MNIVKYFHVAAAGNERFLFNITNTLRAPCVSVYAERQLLPQSEGWTSLFEREVETEVITDGHAGFMLKLTFVYVINLLPCSAAHDDGGQV